jgi:hypothetical protein
MDFDQQWKTEVWLITFSCERLAIDALIIDDLKVYYTTNVVLQELLKRA